MPDDRQLCPCGSPIERPDCHECSDCHDDHDYDYEDDLSYEESF